MSEDDRDIDIESDEDNDSDPRPMARHAANTNYSQAEKRAHHNALERKRRDHIKDSFTSLREAVPSLQGEKVASRAQILKKAAEYIQFMRRKNQAHQQDIDDLKKQNSALESQIRHLEKARDSFASDQLPDRVKSEPESSEEEDSHLNGRRSKKIKSSAYH